MAETEHRVAPHGMHGSKSEQNFLQHGMRIVFKVRGGALSLPTLVAQTR